MSKALPFSVSVSLLPGIALAQVATQATAVVCTGVGNRTPHGAADTFPASVGEL